ncbi:MAG: hypothetical protein JWO80_5914 [Bryobacterales bacterium]|nr:hypothetical protein [Bryobacterales bacterium]
MPRYTFGPFTLDPDIRALLRDGEPIPMAGKAFETLLVLVQNRGRLVDKDELLTRVWAGAVVEEANLTQAIFTVRKTLGDSPKNHCYIVTVPGRGYQFVAPVAEVTNVTAPAGGNPTEARTRWRLSRVLRFGMAGALLAVLAVIAFRWFRPAVPSQSLEPVPLTSGIGFAGSPSFSPDGKQSVYSWRTPEDPTGSIHVKQIGANTELRVTSSPGGDLFPAWSPDARFIAFYREAPGHSGYYVVSALGGSVRQILPVADATGIDWFPDSRHVAVEVPAAELPRSLPETAGSKLHRIASLDIETGERRYLTGPDPAKVLTDANPAVSPDGTMVAFVRSRASDGERDLQVRVRGIPGADIFLVGLDGSPARRLTNFGAGMEGIAWTPDGHELVFAMYQDGRSRLWRTAANGGSAHPITSSMEYVCCPTVARQGHRLAYVVVTGRTSLWRTDISGSQPPGAGAAMPVISSVRREAEPFYSSDGQKIAFASNRTGPGEIWAADAEGRGAVQLTHLGGPTNGTPRWSPDGSEIAFDSRIHGNPEILVVTEEGHNIRRITNNPAEDVVPSWSGEGRWIYFASNRNGDFQIYKVPALNGESPSSPPVQITKGGGFNGVESPDGKYLYFAKGRGKRGLWRLRLGASGDGTEEPVLESLQNWGWWALGLNGVLFLEQAGESSTAKVHLKFLDLSSKRITDLRTLEYPVDSGAATLTFTPHGGHVIYEQGEDRRSDIVLIENFR